MIPESRQVVVSHLIYHDAHYELWSGLLLSNSVACPEHPSPNHYFYENKPRHAAKIIANK
jgi:hypothetical protein